MSIWKKYWKRLLIESIISGIKIISNVIDVNDSVSELTGINSFFAKDKYILMFILTVSVISIVQEISKVNSEKTKLREDELDTTQV